MRKSIIILGLMVFSFLLLGKSQATSPDIYLGEMDDTSDLKSLLNLKSHRILDQIIILPKDEFETTKAAEIISRIDRLPTTLLTKIKDKGIVIKLFNGKLTDNPTVRHLKGVSPRGYIGGHTWDDVPGIGGSKTVLVKIGYSNKGMDHGSVNLELHELAHSIDRHVFNNIRYQKGFLNIWGEEKYLLFPGQTYFLSFPEEYFAECFALYYLGGEYRELLLEKAPKTYKFIKSLK
ncbi:anthrax toxin lethal factor-related metalloendopeptidase [Bacillus massilinigeriensis]|uniref:anthrax toxin lethal factor-related metalloendopeptidase n=1 Tax=Bacillus massilionigeriensis TaxID=1805475 RepID=UPI00096B4D16|nr:toxin [Bacillus massilionigeriensis]